MRTLAHPRFRAAFDFLVLRQSASDGHAEDVAFWREAQDDPDNAIAAHPPLEDVDGDSDSGVAGAESAAPRKRRRRRRRSSAPTE
jgi:poly(A) polymerase